MLNKIIEAYFLKKNYGIVTPGTQNFGAFYVSLNWGLKAIKYKKLKLILCIPLINKNNDFDVKKIDLWNYDLPEFDGDMLNAKYAVIAGSEASAKENNAWAKVIEIFNEFQDADHYIFSVPMWNFSIPYKLKHYIDIVTQPGLSWSYSPEDGYSGLMTGKEATIIYASGDGYGEGTGFESYDLQKPYITLWLTFIGFEKIESLIADRTLFEPEESEVRALKS